VVALPVLITNRQSVTRTGALDVDRRHALYSKVRENNGRHLGFRI
jgi:hypothetical protein